MLDLTKVSRSNSDDPFASWHTGFYAAYYPLPKPAETTKLMERWLDKQFRFERHGGRRREAKDAEESAPNRSFFADPEVQRLTALEVDKEFRSRSVAWVIGTSLGFEFVMLGLATWVFARRDF